MESETEIHFAIGSPPPLHRFPGESRKRAILRQKKEEALRRIQQKRRQERKKNLLASIPGPRFVSWFILPEHVCDRFYFAAMITPGKYYWNRIDELENMRIVVTKNPFTKTVEPFMKEHAKQCNIMRIAVKELYEQNNRVRWAFKYFLTKWRLKHMKDANEEDPVTLSPIEQPVYIYSFPSKRRYIYEAETLAKDFHKKLLHNDGEFPTPLAPRNILTNEPLHLGQIISVAKQCKAYGKTYWSMESFANCSFDIPKFMNLERKQLRLHALNTVFHDPSMRWDYHDMMETFIEGQYETHGKLFCINIYRWALKYIPKDPLIQSWEMACKKWYRVDILTDDVFEKNRQLELIETITKELCVPDSTLVKLRKRFLRMDKK